MTSATKPLFVPLKKEYFLKFQNGVQDCEIRPCGHRFWNQKNVVPGREMTLSNGYGKQNRITKTISRTMVTHDLTQERVPQWHIDAVEAIYGEQDSWLIAYVTAGKLIKCDCLNTCGDDPWLYSGKAYPCASEQKRIARQQEIKRCEGLIETFPAESLERIRQHEPTPADCLLASRALDAAIYLTKA